MRVEVKFWKNSQPYLDIVTKEDVAYTFEVDKDGTLVAFTDDDIKVWINIPLEEVPAEVTYAALTFLISRINRALPRV